MKRFDANDYPDAMRNLDEETRRRAIEEANRLLDRGHGSGRAVAMGIARAQGVDEHRPADGGMSPSVHVLFADREWVIWPEDEAEPTHRFNALEDAFRRAHQLAVERASDLYVFGPGGELIEKSELHGHEGGDSETIEVAPYMDGWAAQKSGAERFFFRFDTKREAVAMARDKARELGARLVIRYQTGEVQEQHDYSESGH